MGVHEMYGAVQFDKITKALTPLYHISIKLTNNKDEKSIASENSSEDESDGG